MLGTDPEGQALVVGIVVVGIGDVGVVGVVGVGVGISAEGGVEVVGDIANDGGGEVDVVANEIDEIEDMGRVEFMGMGMVCMGMGMVYMGMEDYYVVEKIDALYEEGFKRRRSAIAASHCDRRIACCVRTLSSHSGIERVGSLSSSFT